MRTSYAVLVATVLFAVTWTWPSESQSAGIERIAGMSQLTQEQQAAVRAMNQASAPLDQAVTQARNALNAATFTEKPDLADIQAKAESLAAAELARALARAEAFTKLQASGSRLNLPDAALLSLMNRESRGEPGRPDDNRPPPAQGGFETPFVSPIFGDHMVLQRGKPNTIWGWAKPGQEIRVSIADHYHPGISSTASTGYNYCLLTLGVQDSQTVLPEALAQRRLHSKPVALGTGSLPA